MLREPEPEPSKSFYRGAGPLLVAIAAIVALLVALLAYRLYFLIAVIIGVSVAVSVILHFWNKYRPVKENEVENKRPLGLD